MQAGRSEDQAVNLFRAVKVFQISGMLDNMTSGDELTVKRGCSSGLMLLLVLLFAYMVVRAVKV